MENQITLDKELEILENIYHHQDDVRQRDLAAIAGLSLGMTNAIVKRLATKGLLTIRKVNNRNIRYAVSPAGIEAITRKSYRYFKRTIKNVVYYKEAIEELVLDVKERGFEGIVLVGASDLDFVVEHACRKAKLPWVKSEEESENGKIFLLYSESYIPDDVVDRKENTAFLQKILI
jgi:DNA-binding MarR family transcriptional regulator